MVSLPSSPWMVSSPWPPMTVSSPVPPNRKSAPPPPSIDVVAAVAPDRVVVGRAGGQLVIALGAAQHDGVAEEVVVADELQRPVGSHVDQQLAGHRVVQPGRRIEGAIGILVLGAAVSVEVVARLDGVFRRQEHVAGQVLDVGVRPHELGERAVLQRVLVVHALDARQVVEPVGVLQSLHLGAEDVFERGAQHAAEQVDLLGQAADPKIDVVEAGDRAGAPFRFGARGVMDRPRIGVAQHAWRRARYSPTLLRKL